MSNPLEHYLAELQANHKIGVKETSHYGTLQNLFNEIGHELKPRVRLVLHPKGKKGVGIPDGGLFTSDKSIPAEAEPDRGAVEVKGTGEEIAQIAQTEQVRKYLTRHQQVLVTNYRAFGLVGRGDRQEPVLLEEYALAASEKAFWAARPGQLAAEHATGLTEYLKRVMLNVASLTEPEQVAWYLASYARDAKDRIEKADLPALQLVRAGLEEALGLKFEGVKGDHFFRSTLIQTLFYGIFSAWVLWHKENPARTDRFDWRTSVWLLRVPMIRALFSQVATPQQLEPLGLVEVLNWTGAALNRVDRPQFFRRFDEGQAVQYFYEPFLQAFDPALRKDLGVWYTPPEIVRYMVERVDRALRDELGIADGLADPNVYVLDPATGTGSFLVEVLHRIGRTLQDKGLGGLAGSDLKEAATSRVFGFEILPAPFVVAHLQLGLLLQNEGVPLKGQERVGVYLTNALTGWTPPKGPKQQLSFPEMQQERDAAEEVKRDKPILVVIGNPPYNAFAGTSPAEEAGLVEPYKAGLNTTWGIKKFNLDDLYVRFFRLAERRIAETNQPGQGVICYISNASYLSDPSYVVMRRRFLGEFDRLWFDNLNGDSRETGKLTPDGKPDPSVFSTQYNREGIRVGTAIGLLVRRPDRADQPVVQYRQFWGVTKRDDLLASLTAPDFDSQYQPANPDASNRYSFRPSDVKADYQAWPKLTDFAARPAFAGMSEDRRKTLIGIDREAIQNRMKLYFDPKVTWETLEALKTGLTTDVPRFDAKKTRKILLQAETYQENRLVRFAMRPFDLQWCYYTPIRPLWREPRPDYWALYKIGTPALVSRLKAAKDPEGPPITFTRSLCDYHMMPPNASIFPLEFNNEGRKANGAQGSLFGEDEEATRANLSERARTYLTGLGLADPDQSLETAGLVWWHALAIGYAPAYLSENADGIRQDWPRLPLPSVRESLETSARLGQQLAALLDTEAVAPGVTGGTLGPLYRLVGLPVRADGQNIQPDAGDLEVRAGWGHAGKEGVTMPGKGRIITRDYQPDELRAIEAQATQHGLSREEALAQLGGQTCDVYLNDRVLWRNLPARVWDYTIGGYQVIKKWLSYREYELLHRSLTPAEAQEVSQIARRLTAIVLLEPALDRNYQTVKAATYPWAGEL